MKVAIAVLGIIVVALVTACSDDGDTLTLEEYFAEFEAIDADVDAQIGEAFATFPTDDEFLEFIADDANLPVMKGLGAAFVRITSDSLVRVTDLDPPSEVENAHNEHLDAVADLASAFDEANRSFQEVETMAEFVALNDELESTLISPAVARVDEACLDLVAVGEDNGITVNVTCEDAE